MAKLMNSLKYAALFLFLSLQLLSKVNCQMVPPFNPIWRQRHATAFIDNKYYVFGGLSKTGQRLRELFYLDCSKSFNTSYLLWQNIVIPPTIDLFIEDNSLFAMGGSNNKTLFLTSNEIPLMAHISTFDTQTNLWNTNTNLIVDAGVNRIAGGVMDDKGNMYDYVWYSPKTGFVNDMTVFDTINLKWSKRSTPPFSPRCCAGTVFLPDKTIIYIGGYDGNWLSLKEVYLYDTIKDNWNIKTTVGEIPSDRSPVAVLGLDGQRIIIYDYGGNDDPLTVRVLNLINYSWYIPKVSGTIPRIRGWHPADVIGKYMVISFGTYDPEKESAIILLDISNNDEYIWTTEFDPSPLLVSSPPSPPSPTSTSSLTPNTSSNRMIIILVPIFGCSLLIIGSLLFYKWYKNKRVIPTPGNEGGNNHEILMIPGNRIEKMTNQELITREVLTDDKTYNHGRETNQEVIIRETLTDDKVYNHGRETNQEQIIETLIDNIVYNHGQEAIPSTSNEKPLSLQDINNVLRDFKNEIIQAVRQEVTQNQGKEMGTQNNESSNK
ncbi:hypothetical protein C1645_821301 [Glomus cerebriforme]|uniref:Galactose oxidase n=1 Tax=Glomus cerebriforme TaxID=658196 RepID=A0A397TAJ9_9GLOM|nr:hypothetical protein C1645_821301 [Glomus cerebriforme]